ncbi:hypothetical protein TWF694_004939 [Orbilia ellipsospora]|uniref:Uncharacterized protein n=1 Tax=Orbilia ellipsospora TaxID=2528407 RepID=A0AAV9WU38_9PEZI
MAAPSLFTMGLISSALPLSRTRTASLVSHINLTTTGIRYKSTTRRMTKALRLHPHASFIGTASTIPSKVIHPPPPSSSPSEAKPVSRVLPDIIHNPPAAAPSVLVTPRLFIPPSDPRYTLPSPTAVLTSSPAPPPNWTPSPTTSSSSSSSSTEGVGAEGVLEGGKKKLPPALRRPYQKTYHLTESQIRKIQNMRKADPIKNTRKVLAEMFGCSEFYIGMVAPTTEERKKEMRQKLEDVKGRWGKIRTFAREERTRRRVLWSKDL